MNSYKKLVGNSLVFGIGTLGSKIISLALVPLYTYYLSTAEYGAVDLIMTTVTMLLPIASASIFEAVLRFVMDKNKNSNAILSNSIFIGVVGFAIIFSFYPILSYYNVFDKYLLYLYLLLFVQIFESIFTQYTRGSGKIKIFAVNGILLTFLIGILNIFFLVFLEMGIQGYFWAMILSNAFSIIFLISVTNVVYEIRFANINKETMKQMLLYSIPMIPNSIMWWMINASSRYFILFFVGVSANGLFAVASKIPSVISIVNQVFTQAWQLSAIEEYDSENKSKFYTNVFSYLSSLMFLGTSAVIVIVKYLFSFLFPIEYYDSWQVVPFLLLGAVFSSFSGFLGTNYIAAKQTRGVLKTSIYGGIVSLLLNVVFIPLLGIVGAGVSSMFSFFVMFLIRYFDTKKFVEIKVKWGRFFFNIIIIFIQIIILLVSFSSGIEFVIEVILFMVLIIINRNLFTPLLIIMKSLKKR